MKAKSIFWLFLLVIALNSCKDENGPTSNGLITGPDSRECVCCGGYFIEINKTTYRFNNEELPDGSINFDLIDAKFPIKVRVQWHLKEESCLGDEILITKISITS